MCCHRFNMSCQAIHHVVVLVVHGAKQMVVQSRKATVIAADLVMVDLVELRRQVPLTEPSLVPPCGHYLDAGVHKHRIQNAVQLADHDGALIEPEAVSEERIEPSGHHSFEPMERKAG